jgi:hypothetical protein
MCNCTGETSCKVSLWKNEKKMKIDVCGQKMWLGLKAGSISGLYQITDFVICGVSSWGTAEAVTCILHLLACELWHSRTPKRRVLRCYWEKLPMIAFKVLCFQRLRRKHRLLQTGLYSEQVATYCALARAVSGCTTATSAYRSRGSNLVSWKVVQRVFYFLILSDTCRNTLCVVKHSTVRSRVCIPWLHGLILQMTATLTPVCGPYMHPG